MPDSTVTDALLSKINALPAPWCKFSLDKEGRYEIRGQADYDSHDVVRELIYHRFGEETSITMGRLTPIISPMFWETYSGTPLEGVMSLKDPGKHVTAEAYARYNRLARYWKPIVKVFPIDLRAYRGSLLESYDKLELPQEIKVADLRRRINGLNLFRASLTKGEWPKLLVIVPDSPEVGRMERSFTITPHMEVELIRGEGRSQHRGWLYYSPESTDWLVTAWNQKWNTALEYGKSRLDWPSDLISANLITVFKEQCQQFNFGSIERLCRVLSLMEDAVSGRTIGDQSPKRYEAFLCHASVDKGAIVRRFHASCMARGLPTWFDEEEVAWGDRILDKISYGLAKSRFVVVFVSKVSLAKDWVREELNTALTLGVGKEKFVLPVLLGYTIEALMETHPILASRYCLTVPFYDPAIGVTASELECLVNELEKLALAHRGDDGQNNISNIGAQSHGA